MRSISSPKTLSHKSSVDRQMLFVSRKGHTALSAYIWIKHDPNSLLWEVTGVPVITDLGYIHSWLISKWYKSFYSTLRIISAVEWLCVSPPYGELSGCCWWFCHTHTSPLQMTVRISTHPENRLLAISILSSPQILNLAEQISSSVCWAKKTKTDTIFNALGIL